MIILKNNLSSLVKKDEELWFFDEGRFGTHSKVGHAWYQTGVRSTVKIKLGYQNFYLYSAVNPKTGEDFTLILPKVNTECMNVFLKEFAVSTKGRKVAMIMDGAAWHKSKSLKVGLCTRIIIQPPYSPELNPVEKFWQYIKDKTIKNKIFDNLQALEECISRFISSISLEVTRSVCNINYA